MAEDGCPFNAYALDEDEDEEADDEAETEE